MPEILRQNQTPEERIKHLKRELNNRKESGIVGTKRKFSNNKRRVLREKDLRNYGMRKTEKILFRNLLTG
jgi:hypothetical protein